MEAVAQNLGTVKQVIDAFLIETNLDNKGSLNEELNHQISNVFESMPGLAARTVEMISYVKRIGERQKEEEAFFVETRKELITDALKGWLKKNDKDLFYESQFKEFLVK